MRVCDKCGKEMSSGFVIDDGLEFVEYYCSEECLHSEISEEEYDELYECGNAYWTEWDDV